MAPAVGRELAEPVAKEVEEELEGEDDGEAEVGRIQGLLDEGRRSVGLVDLVRFQLRLENGDAEVLLKAPGSGRAVGKLAWRAGPTAIIRNAAVP